MPEELRDFSYVLQREIEQINCRRENSRPAIETEEEPSSDGFPPITRPTRAVPLMFPRI